jgi:hypothetical protein
MMLCSKLINSYQPSKLMSWRTLQKFLTAGGDENRKHDTVGGWAKIPLSAAILMENKVFHIEIMKAVETGRSGPRAPGNSVQYL